MVSGILVLINSILELLIGLIIGPGLVPEESMPLPQGMGVLMVQFLKTVLIVLGAVGIVIGVLMIIAAVQINSGVPGKVKTWSIIGIILSVISILVAGGGFYVGFLLGLIGGILGLTWRPPGETAQPPPQPQAPPPV